MSPCLQFAISMGHPRPLFPLFSSFQYSGQLTFNIKFAEGCLRTVDLWFRKRPSHTTAQVCFFFAWSPTFFPFLFRICLPIKLLSLSLSLSSDSHSLFSEIPFAILKPFERKNKLFKKSFIRCWCRRHTFQIYSHENDSKSTPNFKTIFTKNLLESVIDIEVNRLLIGLSLTFCPLLLKKWLLSHPLQKTGRRGEQILSSASVLHPRGNNTLFKPPPALKAFTGVAIAHVPSPQPTACRSSQ